MCFKKIFKKRDKKVEIPKMDLSKYNFKLSIKAICMYEKLTNKSFYDFNGDDILTFMYCVFVCSNDIDLKLSTFLVLIEDVRISKWLMDKAANIFEIIKQYSKEAEEVQEEVGDKKKPTITEIAFMLIVEYKLDAGWVMNEMDVWQIEDVFKAAEEDVKNRYTEERLWTYLTILPHVDGKKLTSPEKLMPFPWETDNNKKELGEKETAAALAFLNKANKNN